MTSSENVLFGGLVRLPAKREEIDLRARILLD
jgi:hypothetical protein